MSSAVSAKIHQDLPRIEKLGLLRGMERIFVDGSGGSHIAKKKKVRGDQREDARGNQEYVRDEKARNGERAHVRAAAHQAFEAFADQGNFADGVGADGGGEIGFLVPREQVAGESHAQNQHEEHAAGKPEQFAAAFVGAVDICLRKMQQQHDDHRAGAVGMQPAQEKIRR